MNREKPLFYNAMMLTVVNLLLRFVSTSFQVYLSGRIGASGIGLLQLVLSVGALSMTAGMGGIRTATMYLCAETLGQKRHGSMIWVLSGCITYSIILSTAVAFILFHFAPQIAVSWIGDSRTTNAIRLLAYFLPVNCLCGVMVGYFTGTNRIGTLAAVEVVEQLFSMFTTLLILSFWAGSDPAKACCAVIMGSGFGACFTLAILLLIKCMEPRITGKNVPIRNKLLEIAIPLAIADDVKAGISTTENLMVPMRLSLYSRQSQPLAAFGMVCGMVFPVLMFPAAILFGLAEMLIPELARCRAANSTRRIRYLAQKSLNISLVYGCLCGGVLFLAADSLCNKLYHTPEAGSYLRKFALLAPMLYCDAIVDAITKGLGQQKISVRYNIITSAMDVGFLFLLLPKFGMQGYFVSFLVTHLLNFLLSIHLLKKTIHQSLSWKTAFICSTTTVFCIITVNFIRAVLVRCIAFVIMYFSLLVLTGIMNKHDLQWLKSIILPKATD